MKEEQGKEIVACMVYASDDVAGRTSVVEELYRKRCCMP